MDNMREFKIHPYIKYVVLKVDLLLETEIVDEANFSINDEFAIRKFMNKYIYMDDYLVVKIEM